MTPFLVVEGAVPLGAIGSLTYLDLTVLWDLCSYGGLTLCLNAGFCFFRLFFAWYA